MSTVSEESNPPDTHVLASENLVGSSSTKSEPCMDKVFLWLMIAVIGFLVVILVIASSSHYRICENRHGENGGSTVTQNVHSVLHHVNDSPSCHSMSTGGVDVIRSEIQKSSSRDQLFSKTYDYFLSDATAKISDLMETNSSISFGLTTKLAHVAAVISCHFAFLEDDVTISTQEKDELQWTTEHGFNVVVQNPQDRRLIFSLFRMLEFKNALGLLTGADLTFQNLNSTLETQHGFTLSQFESLAHSRYEFKVVLAEDG